jgi:hypothetical protein
MEGFDPGTSFGHDASKRYDAASIRGDEEETVEFLAELAGQRDALEFAVGTGRIALPLTAAGVRVDGIEMSRAHDRPNAREARREQRRGDGRRHVPRHHRAHLWTDCAWLTHPSSTSWLASPDFDCATDGQVGTVSRTPPRVGAMSASTSERRPGRSCPFAELC